MTTNKKPLPASLMEPPNGSQGEKASLSPGRPVTSPTRREGGEREGARARCRFEKREEE